MFPMNQAPDGRQQEYPAYGRWEFSINRIFGNDSEAVSDVSVYFQPEQWRLRFKILRFTFDAEPEYFLETESFRTRTLLLSSFNVPILPQLSVCVPLESTVAPGTHPPVFQTTFCG